VDGVKSGEVSGLDSTFSLLLFLGRVDDRGFCDVGEYTGVSIEIVCHFSASSLKFFEPGEFMPLLIFLCEIARSFGLSFFNSSVLDFESLDILSPIELELRPFEYFFSNSLHLLTLSELLDFL